MFVRGWFAMLGWLVVDSELVGLILDPMKKY